MNYAMELLSICLELKEKQNKDLFFTYHPHVDSINIFWWENGIWDSKEVYPSSNNINIYLNSLTLEEFEKYKEILYNI